MPEYLAPGVYVEETSFRSKSIEGVSTTTTGFVGPTRYGPTDIEPEVVTSLVEFERMYGDGQPLVFVDQDQQPQPPVPNFMWQAARGFFGEGGKRLYISRVFEPIRDPRNPDRVTSDGRAQATIPQPAGPGSSNRTLRVAARFPGAVGKMRVTLTLQLGQNILAAGPGGESVARGLSEFDVVCVTDRTPKFSPLDPDVPDRVTFHVAELDRSGPKPLWQFIGPGAAADPLRLTALVPNADPKKTDTVRVVTLK